MKNYKGSWFALFAHPSDFIPFYTSEFVYLQTMYSGLRELDVNFAGLSVDNIFPQVTWLNNIEGLHNANRVFWILIQIKEYR
ncbi:redoxin domain-containing protein [Staphylococcus saprophyticus]|uniref:redoxin domain-containing protein n=1 Tax=Staphylococcus saprophyticus TaxID=29385 RepID=UPI0022EAFB61|nr:redoxin domain-containing protein [Staphylococcus saprophyticus]